MLKFKNQLSTQLKYTKDKFLIQFSSTIISTILINSKVNYFYHFVYLLFIQIGRYTLKLIKRENISK